MSDWQSKSGVTGRDAMKAAAVILGLMFLCIFVLWVLTRLIRQEAPPPRMNPPTPGLPTPAPPKNAPLN